MKVLFVLTSHARLGNTSEKTGFWIEEFAAPYYALTDAGVQITISSPAGGKPPVDPKSALPDFQTEATRRFDQDEDAQDRLANTLKLSDILAADYDAVFYPGGHGPLWDLTDNHHSIALIESFVQQNKPVATVCHASAVLLKARDSSGQPLIKNKQVTGFSNSEEEAVNLTDVVPFLLEDELTRLGAIYKKQDDWCSYIVEDGLLITGQNPASSEAVAQALLTKLK